MGEARGMMKSLEPNEQTPHTTFIRFSSQLVIFNADIRVGKKVSTTLTSHKTPQETGLAGTGHSLMDTHADMCNVRDV